MKAWFARRYLDLLGSIYIYNEHRGYTALDRVLEAVKAKHPEATELIAAVEKHRADFASALSAQTAPDRTRPVRHTQMALMSVLPDEG